jgi:hypothetical protein
MDAVVKLNQQLVVRRAWATAHIHGAAVLFQALIAWHIPVRHRCGFWRSGKQRIESSNENWAYR